MSIDNTLFLELVEAAIRSPSGHNTQPWKFALTADGNMKVMPDYTRTLPATDPSNRELLISVGCATESISIYAASKGFSVHEQPENDAVIISFTESNKATDKKLSEAISTRQTNRNPYNGTKISHEAIGLLKAEGIMFYENGTHEFAIINEHIETANNIQMNDERFKQELKQYMRYCENDARKSGDGLSYDTLGVPSIPVFMRKSATALSLNASMQNRFNSKKIAGSSHFIVITGEDTVPGYIDTGRRLMRLLLKAETLGIACAYMNQPCELSTVRNMLKTALSIDGVPQIILRMGYSSRTPRSHRRPTISFIE